MIDPDGVHPTCVEVEGTDSLEVVNATDQFPQYAETFDVSLAGYPTVRVAPGATSTFDDLGAHLAAGKNLFRAGSQSLIADVWLMGPN